MPKWFVLLAMLFCHIVDDYYLQAIGPLASMKQKRWWKENHPHDLYKHDYIAALIAHGVSWAFMIMLPVVTYYGGHPPVAYYVLFVTNTAIHALVDHLKANVFVINLLIDQTAHVVQILLTFFVLVV